MERLRLFIWIDKGDIMNVIVSNLNGDKFDNLNVDIIKSISGEFTVDEIVQTFSNFFFNKMFLDITAIQNLIILSNYLLDLMLVKLFFYLIMIQLLMVMVIFLV